MARPTIENVRQLGTYASQNRWQITFAKFPNIGNYPDSENLNFRCTSSTVPKLTEVNNIDVNIRGMHISQPGDYDFDHEWTGTFFETVDATVLDFLREWRQACWEYNTGKQNNKADVEAILILTRLDFQDAPMWQYKLTGCYIKDYDPGAMENEAGAIQGGITLWYDYFQDGKSV
jgi:hypothetical protein